MIKMENVLVQFGSKFSITFTIQRLSKKHLTFRHNSTVVSFKRLGDKVNKIKFNFSKFYSFDHVCMFVVFSI